MKIAFIGQKGIPAESGGIERHVDELSQRLAKSGLDVFVYCRPWYAKEKNYKNVKLIFLPSIKTKHLDAISHTFLCTLHALIKGFDIIHYHGVGPSLLSFLPRLLRPKTKVIATFHCIDRKHQKWGKTARIALRIGEWAACRFAHSTITVSRTLTQYCAEAYDKETKYIPNGVPCQGICLSNRLIKEKFGLERNKYLLMVSRLVRHKGAHYLIAAYKDLKKENTEQLKDLKLVITGGSAFTDDYVKSLKELSSNEPDIIFTDAQNGKVLEELFNNACFIIHPSESEGLPLVILEAMSYGKAVLASDIPENMELVEKHGFSFKNKDIDDLKEKIRNIIDEPLLVKKTGQKAKKFVMEEYSWEDIVKQTENIYFDVKDKVVEKKLLCEAVK